MKSSFTNHSTRNCEETANYLSNWKHSGKSLEKNETMTALYEYCKSWSGSTRSFVPLTSIERTILPIFFNTAFAKGIEVKGMLF